MPEFIIEDFLLQTKTAKILYHEHAKQMPIYDYHCHLPADLIASEAIKLHFEIESSRSRRFS